MKIKFLKKAAAFVTAAAMSLSMVIVLPEEALPFLGFVANAESSSSNNNRLSLGGDGYSSAYITENGDLYTWGHNNVGQLGDGTTNDRYIPEKIMSNVSQVSFREYYSACITTNGDLYTWGANDYGVLGIGYIPGYHSATPQKIAENVSQVSLGVWHIAYITTNGDLYTWGNNEYGQLGDGTKNNRYTPQKIMSNVSQISLGDYHSACITTNGDLYTWGSCRRGVLGDDAESDRDTPVKIMSGVSQVSLGGLHSACVTENGDLYTWGANWWGQLGDDINISERNMPVKIMSNVSQVSLGDSNSACITTNGDLYTWGNDAYGKLGDGNNENKYTPVKIMSNVSQVSLGVCHGACITTNGDLYTWGRNNYGQLGNGTTTDSNIPIKIELDSGSSTEENGYIKLDPLSDEGITVGGGESILAYVYDKDDNRLSNVNLVWTSSDENVVAITESNNLGAVVEGKSAGEATITCEDTVSGAVGELKIVVRKGVDISEEYDTRDTDGDGLPDVWEKYGITYEGEFLDLPAMGADPYKSDIFVEVDWMNKFNPDDYANALKLVYMQFQNHGINLHIDAGATSIDYVTGKQWGQQSSANETDYFDSINTSDVKSSGIKGSWKDIIDENFNNNILRTVVFRYCIMGNKVYDGKNYITGIAGNIPSQYFYISYGLIHNNAIKYNTAYTNDETIQIAGTFMHELGHTLGLYHGGFDNNGRFDAYTNYKVNYLSIMNYSFQLSGLIFDDYFTNETSLSGLVKYINYSEYSLLLLDEVLLNENIIIDNQGVTQADKIKSVYYDENRNKIEVDLYNPIDFNGDGEYTFIPMYDINKDNKFETFRGTTNDWKHIIYKGGCIGGNGAELSHMLDIFNTDEFDFNIPEEAPADELIDIHNLATEYSSDETGHWYECSDCDDKVDFEEHTEDNGMITLEPTETTEGVKTFKCTKCEYVIRTEPIAVLEHTHSLATEYSSDETGHWYTCSGCDEKVDFAAHIEDSGTVTIEPTETTEGVKTFKCTECGYVIRTEPIAVLEHTHRLATEYSSDETGHWYACSGCDEKVDFAAHTEDSGTVTTEPTETAEGVKTFKCVKCEYVMRTETIPTITPEHTHEYSTEWKSDSRSHWHECSCGDKSNIGQHISNGGIVTVQPTATSTGLRVYSCSICGYVLSTETIPATGNIYPNYPTYPTYPTYPFDSSIFNVVTFTDKVNVTAETEGNTITIKWDKVEKADKYYVYQYKNGKYVKVKTTSDTSATFKKLKNGETYKFLVRYTKSGRLSPTKYSGTISVKIYYKPIPKPTATKNSIKLTWEAVPEAEKYAVYKYVDGKAIKLTETKKLSVKIGKLIPDTEYKYIVRAYVDGKWTTMLKSDIVTVKTKAE